jgi:excinuclease ABC subunit C
VVLPDGTDADVVAFAEDPLEAAVQVFYVRGGRVRGQRGWVVDKVEELSTGELVEQFLTQVYGGDPGSAGGEDVPRSVLVPALPPDPDVLTEWLCRLRGGRVELRVPQRGDKRDLLETVARNAQQALALHKTRRAADLTTRSRALQEIQDALGLEQAPLRVECFDVSNLHGSDVVASMVVFEDGLARPSEYRRFAVRGLVGQDDVCAIREVVTRRFRRYLEEQERGGALPDADAGGAPRTFAYPPNLVVVDGGRAQVEAAAAALADLGIEEVAVCGLAKRLEEVWLPGEPDPVVLPRTSEGLYLLQRVRDEAHRFAIAYHRQKRSRRMRESVLDGVAGLGDVRRKALLRHFGSLRRLRAASVEEIAAVPGIGRRTAQAVRTALVGTAADGAPGSVPGPAVDPATGEILDEVASSGEPEEEDSR